MDTASELRDEGMARASSAEEKTQPTFGSTAFEAIKKVAARQSTVHVDDVLAECAVTPRHPNAWGAVWFRAIKGGLLKRTGEVRPCATDPGKHKHNYPVYSSAIFKEAA